MTFFDLVLQTVGSLHPDGGPDRFISEYAGFILAEGDDGRVRRVGKVHAHRIHAGLAARHGESLSDVCACHSHALHEAHALLYEPGQYHFREILIDRFDATDCDCLVVDYVVLHPRWRGLRLGLLAVRKLLDLLGGGCGLAVSEVLPLDPEAHDLLNVPPSWLPRRDLTPLTPQHGFEHRPCCGVVFHGQHDWLEGRPLPEGGRHGSVPICRPGGRSHHVRLL